MHERTERALCRLSFLLLCALPTLLTVFLTFLTWTPWYHNRRIRSMESVLSQRLGVTVKLADVRRPSPESWQLEGVELYDPETSSLVARVRTVLYTVRNEMVGIHLSQPEVQSAQLSLVWRIAHDRFLCQPDLLGQAVNLEAQDLSIHSNFQGLTLSPVRIRIAPTPEETRASLQFLMAGWSPKDLPTTVTVTRFRSSDQPHTEWRLQTGSKPLPCGVLAEYLPIMRRLGPDAEFSGYLSWRLERDDYTVQLKEAKFVNVNMLELFEPLDYHVSGNGTIRINSLTRHSGNPISEATGQIAIQSGRIEVGLLRKLSALFRAELLPMEIPDRERIDFQAIATGFQVYGNSLEARGICRELPNFEAADEGTAVVAYDRPILLLNPRNRIASNQLTSTIDPSGRTRIPIGTDKNWARSLLPQLENSRPAIDVDSPPKEPRIRLQR